MAASAAVRSTMARSFCRATTTNVTAASRVSAPLRPSIRSDFMPRFSSSPLRLLRRELSSLRPLHSAIASACLVSKLPNDATPSSEGRFANYLSPI